MMCHRIGIPPISIMGFGLSEVSSPRRVPSPPARMTACTSDPLRMTLGAPRVQPDPCYGPNGRAARCQPPGATPSLEGTLKSDQHDGIGAKFESFTCLEKQTFASRSGHAVTRNGTFDRHHPSPTVVDSRWKTIWRAGPQ